MTHLKRACRKIMREEADAALNNEYNQPIWDNRRIDIDGIWPTTMTNHKKEWLKWGNSKTYIYMYFDMAKSEYIQTAGPSALKDKKRN
jgi:hypothetical protein